MKKIILSTILFFITIQIYSQAPSIQWQKSFGGSMDDRAVTMAITSDGGYIVAGYSNSNDGDISGHHGGTTTSDGLIVKFDNTGNIQWQKSLGGSYNEVFGEIRQTSDGGYITAGFSASNDGDITGHHGAAGKYDAWIVKLNNVGTIQWQKSFGGTLDDYASSIKETADSSYIFSGTSDSNDGDVSTHHGSSANPDVWIVKIDNTGNILWQNDLGGSDFDFIGATILTNDGGCLTAGTSQSMDGDITGNHGSGDGWLVKLNSMGILQWQKCLGGSGYDDLSSIRQSSSNSFILSGYSNSSNGDLSGTTFHGVNDCWETKIDSMGTIIWTKLLGGSKSDLAGTVENTTDGGYIYGCVSNSNDFDVTSHYGLTTSADFWAVKVDSMGSIQWQKSYGGSLDENSEDIKQTSDGGYIGITSSLSSDFDLTLNHGNYDCWIFKLAAASMGINENTNNLLITAYPNPSAGEVHIMGLKNENTIEIFDITGRLISKVISIDNPYSIDLSDKDKGVYFYKVTNNKKETKSGKIILN